MLFTDKNIICLEPWGGNGISEKDTGLGNRIIHWAALYYISSQYLNSKIILEKKYWPELEFLDLPNTVVEDVKFEEVKNTSLHISSQDIEDIIYNKNLNIFNTDRSSYYSDTFIALTDEVLREGLRKIQFKNEKINKFFKDNFSNFSSIHLRRGIGTIPTIGFIKDFLFYNCRTKLKEYLIDYYFSSAPSSYMIMPDSAYFLIIDEIISLNKKQKFYISSDISETYYLYYFDKYPNNFVKKEEYLKEFLNLCNCDITKSKSSYEYSLEQSLKNLFDLFVLANSKVLIMDKFSTWGRVAFLMLREKKKINIIEYVSSKNFLSYEEFVKKYSYEKVFITPWSELMS